MLRAVLAVILTTLLAGGTEVPAADAGRPRLPIGRWGGQHVSLEATADGGSLVFDCAHGRVKGPLYLDAEGRFDVPGTYARERGGPQRVGEDGREGETARYRGRVEDDLLTLTVRVGAEPEDIGTFRLRRGQTPRIVKCR